MNSTRSKRKIPFHKFSKMFPMIGGEAWESFCESIGRHGLVHPIVLFEDKILDGKLRYLACLREKVEPRFIQFEGTWEDALNYLWDMNVCRASYNPDQQAAGRQLREELDRLSRKPQQAELSWEVGQ